MAELCQESAGAGAKDLIWGAEGIAAEIDRTPRQTHHMLSQGVLPARKVGGRWVASRKALAAFFSTAVTGGAIKHG